MAKKRTFPGTIYSPANADRLYIKYKGKRLATGLRDTPEGRRIAARMLEDMYKEMHGLKERHTVTMIKEAFQEFEDKHCSNKTKKTTAGYKEAFKQIVPVDYSMDIDRIEQDVLKFMAGPKLAPASKNIYLRAFQVFINFCSERKYLKEYNFYKRYKKTVQTKTVQVFTQDEVKKLIEHFTPIDIEFALLIRFLCACGYRIHEALEMKWSDITADHIEKQSKHGHDTQYFPLTAELREIFSQVPKKNRVKVFRWQPTTHSRLLKTLNEGMAKCNIPKQRRGFHNFRKTFRMRLLDGGVQLEDVKDLMGHENINVTMNHYTLVELKRLKTAMESLPQW